MRTIYEAKSFVKSALGKDVVVKVLGIRNKVDRIEGIISECYSHVFVVRTKFGNKSFTYTDVLIGNIRVDVK